MTAPPAMGPPTGAPVSNRRRHPADIRGRSPAQGRSQRETAPLCGCRHPPFPLLGPRPRPPPSASACAPPPSSSTSSGASSPPSASPRATPPASMSPPPTSSATAARRSAPRGGISAGSTRRWCRPPPTSLERVDTERPATREPPTPPTPPTATSAPQTTDRRHKVSFASCARSPAATILVSIGGGRAVVGTPVWSPLMHVRASISTTGHRRLPTRADGGLRHGARKGLAARRAHQPRRRRPARPTLCPPHLYRRHMNAP